MPQVDLKGHTVEELASVANVSVDAIKRAIEMRQKQMMAVQEEQMRKKSIEDEVKREEQIAKQLAMYQQEQQKYLATSTFQPVTTTRTTTTTTTPRPTRKSILSYKVTNKISNAASKVRRQHKCPNRNFVH